MERVPFSHMKSSLANLTAEMREYKKNSIATDSGTTFKSTYDVQKDKKNDLIWKNPRNVRQSDHKIVHNRV